MSTTLTPARRLRLQRRWRFAFAVGLACLMLAGMALASAIKWIPERNPPVRVSTSQSERDYAFAQFGAFANESLKPPNAEALADRWTEMLTRGRDPSDRHQAPYGPLDPDKTRLVRAHDPKIYLLAGEYNLCIFTEEEPGPGGSGGCGDPWAALGRQGPSTSLTMFDNGFRITVLAPDSVKSVTVQRFDCTNSLLRLKNNVATQIFKRKPRSMTSTDDLGRPQIRLFRRNGSCPPAAS